MSAVRLEMVEPVAMDDRLSTGGTGQERGVSVSQVDVRLLGPMEVEVSGERVQFDGAKLRRLFAVLALRVPDAVSDDELAEALWGEHPPPGAVPALQKQISRLRQRLGTHGLAVCRRPAGYCLDVDPGSIDCRRFEELLRRARAALSRDDARAAVADLHAALGLWRGEPLADFRFDEFAQHEIARLEELRLEAVEERLAAELGAGGAEDLVGELRALVAEHPLRERLRGQLMVALYRAGRQADALETMRAGRQLLVDELGIEPGPELRQLERMILAHDPSLTIEHPGTGLAGHLPAQVNETIGRERELLEIEELLRRGDVRLVTLVGPGGVGKTRLALEAARAVAAQFPAGAVHVSLDGAEDAAVLIPAAASALGVVAATAPELGERLSHATRGAPALLVLDGFDRRVEDARQIGQLLSDVANLTVLATGRAPLRLSAEHVYRVRPMSAPNAAALFTARASAVVADRAIGDDRSIIDAICARLDGLPLAIELAADRARLLPLPALLERLEHRLELLTGGPCDLPLRQRSLRATLELSWEALDEPERELLGRLTVFEGGASLAAAEAVFGGALGGGLETLFCSLLDNSSLLRTDSGREAQVRIGMLDTVREFAVERAAELEDLSTLERRHADYFLNYCEHAAEQAARTDHREWLDLLARERANIRLAFDRLLRSGAVDEALRLAIAFASALPWDAHVHEVRAWLSQAIEASPAATPALRASGLYWDGALALSMGLFDDAEAQLKAALAAAQAAGDAATEAAALSALGRRAVLTSAADAIALCEAAVNAARRVGERTLIADALLSFAGACERCQVWERAEALAEEALELYRAVGDPYGAAWALAEQGWYDVVHGRLDESEQRLAEALELRRRHGDDRRLVEPLIDHAWLMLARGQGDDAARGFLDCFALARHMGDQFNVGEALAGLSTHAGRERRWDDAALLAGASAAVHEEIGAPPWGSVAAIQERVLADARRAAGAHRYASRFAEGRRLAPEDATARTQCRAPDHREHLALTAQN
ncbi:MAG: winged helix-turn-helix domain-containing protein [Conexibacteraceae bacterium]|nr:winged helix-turn-helix domain-containing protein [Conexibacteraceae bacterium]